MSSGTRIVLVDDEETVRASLRTFVDALPGYEVVGVAANAVDAEAMVAESHPDIALLDIAMGTPDGIQLARTLKHHHPTLLLIMLSSMDESMFAELSLHAGASGYVMKDNASDQLFDALETVRNGGISLSQDLLQRLTPEADVDDLDLDQIEERVLEGYASGLATTHQLAGELDRPEPEVVNAELAIMRKLGVSSQVGLRLFAVQHAA